MKQLREIIKCIERHDSILAATPFFAVDFFEKLNQNGKHAGEADPRFYLQT